VLLLQILPFPVFGAVHHLKPFAIPLSFISADLLEVMVLAVAARTSIRPTTTTEEEQEARPCSGEKVPMEKKAR